MFGVRVSKSLHGDLMLCLVIFKQMLIYPYTYILHTHTHMHVNALGSICWAEARIKITRMTLTIKLDRNWSSFQLANSAPPLSVTGSAIAPSARMSKFERTSSAECSCVDRRLRHDQQTCLSLQSHTHIHTHTDTECCRAVPKRLSNRAKTQPIHSSKTKGTSASVGHCCPQKFRKSH